MIDVPNKRKGINALIIITLIALFFVSLLVSKHFSLPNVIWQGVFFVGAIVICQLSVKYFLPVYTYSFDDGSFIITKTMGKKITTVCNIDTPRIVALYDKDEYKKQEQYVPRGVYNYCGNIIPNSCCVLIFEYSDCCEAVVFEPKPEMAKAIRALTENR